MVIMKRRLACCSWDKGVSIDFDQQDRIMTYNGLESCIINANSYENESGTTRDGCASDSQDEDDSSCSSSNNACSSFSSHWTMMKRDEQGPDVWECSDGPQHFYVKEKPSYTVQLSDVETMKEKFAKLLLGDDITGGCKGLSTAVALSNAITNLAGTIFGELWKLEPLPNERKSKWRREMDWLLSPANYMVELVPAKQHGANGRMLEIMTPKVRSDIHMILPALQKLDSMLMETLDSMKSTEFWYAEGGSRAEGRSKEGPRQSKRWWLPLPQVPKTGLSDMERKKLLDQGKFVHQVFKASNSINDNVLHEMEIPPSVREALPKSGKASLGDDLYKMLNAESTSVAEILDSLNLKSERSALETINKLEAAALVWKARISDQAVGKSPVRTSWSFKKDPISELDKMEHLVCQAESLIKQLKIKYPNLPQSFLDVTKIQYGTDVGHSILEAYSRALANLAFRILSRIGDILQEDVLSNPNSPIATCCFPGINLAGVSDTTTPNLHVRQSLIDRINSIDRKFGDTNAGTPQLELSYCDSKSSSVIITPSRSHACCIGREGCNNASSTNSP